MSQRYEIRMYDGVEPRENASRKWGASFVQNFFVA